MGHERKDGHVSTQARWYACERLVDCGLPEATFGTIETLDPVAAALVARRLAAALADVRKLLEANIHPTFGVEPSIIKGSVDARSFEKGIEALRSASIRTYDDLVRKFWWGWCVPADSPPEGRVSVMSLHEMNERTALALKRHLTTLKLIEPDP